MTPPFKPIPEHLDYLAGSAGALAQLLASQITYREGVNNDNAFGVWYPMNHQPWCAIFLSWGAWAAGVPTSVIPKHAYTPAGADWFRSRGRLYTAPKAGDLGYVYFPSMGRIGHVFFVERIRYVGGVLIMDTIEGNTNTDHSPQGNGVYRLVRVDTSNLSYGRPAYAAGTPPDGEGGGDPIDLPSEEDDMQYLIIADAGRGGPAYAWTPTTIRPINGPYFDSLVKAGAAKKEILFLPSLNFDHMKDMTGFALRQAAAIVDAALADDFADLEEFKKAEREAPTADALVAETGATPIKH